MGVASDRFRFILDRPIETEPGAKWTYCGATALLARLIAKGTGETLPAYCRKVLFDPLGLGPSEWSVGADGKSRAASGLRLRPRGLVKLGQLVLASGSWNGHSIAPADGVKRVTTPVIAISYRRSYGYHWHMGDFISGAPPQPSHWLGGIGWGGQYLLIFPAHELVVVIHCGNYKKLGQNKAPCCAR